MIRNVFVYSGSIIIITDYDKVKLIRDIRRKVAWFVDDSIGCVLIMYIA